MKSFLIRLVVNAVALAAAAWLIGGVQLSPGLENLLVVALIFGLVNAFIKPVLKILSLPLIFLTLGLFTFVINALMLMLTAAFTVRLSVSGFGAALLGSIVISIVSLLLSTFVDDEKERH